MSRSSEFPMSAPRPRPRPRYSTRLRGLAWGLVAVVAGFVFALRAKAQTSNARAFALRPTVGALIGTGDMHDALKSAVVIGGQASFAVQSNFALIGSFAYSPSQDKLSIAQPKLDIYQYDLGIEGRLDDLSAGMSVATRPFAVIGGGGRTYNYRNLAGTSAQTNPLGYGAIGLDLAQANGPIGIRLEARDNLTGFKGFRGELPDRKARNDVQLSAGLTFAF